MASKNDSIARLTGYFLGGLLFALIGGVIAANGVELISLNDGINAHKKSTVGIVKRVRSDQAWGFQPVIEFSDHDGVARTFTSPTYYHWFFTPEDGEKVPVRYSEFNPDLALIDSFWGRYGRSVEVGVVGGGIFLFGLVVMISVFFPNRSE